MRQLMLLAVLLLGAVWAVGQKSAEPAQKGSTSATAGSQTVEGCLSGSEGKYTLTDKQGQTFELTGDTSKLAEHVGHEVKITGTAGTGPSASAASGGMSLEVSSVKHISKTCKSGGGMSH